MLAPKPLSYELCFGASCLQGAAFPAAVWAVQEGLSAAGTALEPFSLSRLPTCGVFVRTFEIPLSFWSSSMCF